MIVSKFGGTSVESFEAMSRSAQIIADNPNRSWIVISATAGTLNDLCNVEVEYNLVLVAVIGNAMHQTSGISGQLFSILKDYSIRLVCHVASANNVCFLVQEYNAETVVQTLHQSFIG